MTQRKTIIVTEKPAFSRALSGVLSKQPDFSDDNILFVHATISGPAVFRYPRGLNAADYPIISEPVDRIVPGEHSATLRNHAYNAWGSLNGFNHASDCTTDAFIMPDLNTLPPFAELFGQTDRVIVMTDSDQSSQFSAYRLLEAVYGAETSAAMSWVSYPLVSLLADDIVTTLGRPEQLSVNSPHVVSGLVKRYFDWNFNVNSLHVFGQLIEHFGIDRRAFFVSKYVLLAMHVLHRAATITSPSDEYSLPMSLGQIFELLRKWKGTGHFFRDVCSVFFSDLEPGIGSHASRGMIIDQLMKMGFLTALRSDRGQVNYTISDHGMRIMDAIHQRTYDPDLPFRIANWGEMGLTRSKPHIDQYIRSVFGRQQRYLQNTKSVDMSVRLDPNQSHETDARHFQHDKHHDRYRAGVRWLTALM